jgi:hypothetical protein
MLLFIISLIEKLCIIILLRHFLLDVNFFNLWLSCIPHSWRGMTSLLLLLMLLPVRALTLLVSFQYQVVNYLFFKAVRWWGLLSLQITLLLVLPRPWVLRNVYGSQLLWRDYITFTFSNIAALSLLVHLPSRSRIIIEELSGRCHSGCSMIGAFSGSRSGIAPQLWNDSWLPSHELLLVVVVLRRGIVTGEVIVMSYCRLERGFGEFARVAWDLRVVVRLVVTVILETWLSWQISLRSLVWNRL